MNTRTQFDAHPDAEILNAFAEQALGDREREHIMAHLAMCGRCRSVVFLAQEAAGLEMEVAEKREEELVPAAAMPVAVAPAATRAESVEPRVAWYRNWWMMWVPVGALAVIVALATVMHVRHVEQNSEMAKSVRIVPPTEQSELQAPAEPARNAGREEPGLQAGPANREGKAVAKGEARELGKRASAQAGAPSVLPPPLPALSSSFGSGASEAREEGFMARSAEASGEPRRQQAEAAESKKERSRSVAEAQVQLQAAPAVSPSSSEKVTVQQADRIAAVPPESSLKAGGSLKATHGALAVGTFAAYKMPPTKLPSGLPAVSTATGEHVVLGVDKAGNVFLSADAGVHWEAVPRQWNGRAVAVRKEEAGKKDDAAGAEISSAKFELVNEEGKVWVSGDGRTWTAK